MAWSNVIGAVGSLGSAYMNKEASKKGGNAHTVTQQTTLDPRMDGMLFGDQWGQGLIGRYRDLLDAPQSESLKRFAGTNANYLDWMGEADLGNMRNAALRTMNGNSAPTMQAAR